MIIFYLFGRILAGDHWEPVFLVAGDDNQVHLYRESHLSSEVGLLGEAWIIYYE